MTCFTWRVTTDQLLRIFDSIAVKRKVDWITKIGTTIFTNIQDARDNQHQWKHAKIQSQRKIHEIERRYEELEKRVTGKHEAAATEEVEIPERQHTTTTAAQRAELTGEAEQQHATKTAAHWEATIDTKDRELFALTEKRKNMDRKEKSQVKDISKKIKKRIKDKKRSTRHEKVQNILGKFKGITLIANIKTKQKNIWSRKWEN